MFHCCPFSAKLPQFDTESWIIMHSLFNSFNKSKSEKYKSDKLKMHCQFAYRHEGTKKNS